MVHLWLLTAASLILLTAPYPVPSKQEGAKEISRLIDELGAESADARLDARKRLRSIGAPGLPLLERAIYHEIPDVRVEAKSLIRLIRTDIEVESSLRPVREAVRKIRERWKARDFEDLEHVAKEAFAPMRPLSAHYVPKKEVGGSFRVARRESDPDLLSPALDEALNKGEGLVCIDVDGTIRPFSSLFVFSLPDRKGWSAYLVVQVASSAGVPAVPGRFKSQMLASTENRMVWGIDPDEITWLGENQDAVLDQVQLSTHASGGVKIEKLVAGSFPEARGLKAADIIRELNGSPINKTEDVREFLKSPSFKQSTGLRMTIDRGGKPFVVEFRPLPR